MNTEKEIRLFGITSIILLVFGVVMIVISGKATPDLLTLNAQPTVIRVVTAIVITQTREPVDPFTGVWSCKNAERQQITIAKEGNFYNTKFSSSAASLAVQQNNELTTEDGHILRLSNDADILAVRTQSGKAFFCEKTAVSVVTTITPTP